MIRRITLVLGFMACGWAASAEGPRRIALVSDPHVSSKPAEAAYVRHFEKVIEEVNAADVAAVLIAGDLTQGGAGEDMERFKEMVKGFKSKVWYVPGNHDVGNRVLPGQKTSLGESRLKNYEGRLGRLWWSQEVMPGVRVVGICSSLMGSGLDREREQWEFLAGELPRKKEGEVVILLSHYPPFVKDLGEADEYFNMETAARKRLLELLSGAGVKTMLSGHLHRPVEYTSGGVHVIGAPAVSFGLPRGKQPEGWVLVTLAEDGTCTRELKYLPPDPPPATK